jgi:D-glycero-D-manno-heptose 1,7-bisphosphate phosphatase
MSAAIRTEPAPPRRAAFLDRDGVINVDTGYVYRWEDFQFIPGAIEGMRRLHQAGYALVVITNQSGIARGYYSEKDFEALSTKMCAYLAEQGCPITAVYHCPHLPSGSVAPYNRECECRKPMPGMIQRACSEWHFMAEESLLIGDKPSDMQAGRAANIGQVFLVHSGQTLDTAAQQSADLVFQDLNDCVNQLLA